jgi:demethylmenaquinone methyltransferase/2-methoxy-6-polyprenyl-1,4-benzoquinol methylase
LVHQAQARADAHGFPLSCEPGVGALLSSLAAALPAHSRILELGTGAGVGLAWLFHGLGARSDVAVVSVDIDPELQALARRAAWSDRVQFQLGDGCELLPRLGSFDLIFADAPGGKLEGLDRSIAALAPGGMLIVDDMDLSLHDDPELRAGLKRVRSELLAVASLHTVELDFSSGVMLAVRRRKLQS